MKLRNLAAIIVLVGFLTKSGLSQATWKAESVTDPLRGTHYLQYELEGLYLTAPHGAKPDITPSLIVRCQPDPKANHGHARGHFMSGYIYTSAVIDSSLTHAGEVHVQFRRDSNKLEDR